MTTTQEKTCCFTGHRPEKLPWKHDETAPDCLALKRLLAELLAALYADGYRDFLCGMAAGADLYFGEAVVALRDEHPDARLLAVVPFQGQEQRWPEALRQRYFRLSLECDDVTVLHSRYRPGCMMERNRYMVDRAGLLIAVYDGRPGGTKNTLDYAAARGRRILALPVAGLTAP